MTPSELPEFAERYKRLKALVENCPSEILFYKKEPVVAVEDPAPEVSLAVETTGVLNNRTLVVHKARTEEPAPFALPVYFGLPSLRAQPTWIGRLTPPKKKRKPKQTQRASREERKKSENRMVKHSGSNRQEARTEASKQLRVRSSRKQKIWLASVRKQARMEAQLLELDVAAPYRDMDLREFIAVALAETKRFFE